MTLSKGELFEDETEPRPAWRILFAHPFSRVDSFVARGVVRQGLVALRKRGESYSSAEKSVYTDVQRHV